MITKQRSHYFDTDQSWNYRDELQHEWHRFSTCNGVGTEWFESRAMFELMVLNNFFAAAKP